VGNGSAAAGAPPQGTRAATDRLGNLMCPNPRADVAKGPQTQALNHPKTATSASPRPHCTPPGPPTAHTQRTPSAGSSEGARGTPSPVFSRDEVLPREGITIHQVPIHSMEQKMHLELIDATRYMGSPNELRNQPRSGSRTFTAGYGGCVTA
jgi:hypothetical protein